MGLLSCSISKEEIRLGAGDAGEVLRFLGYHGQELDQKTQEQIEAGMKKISDAAVPGSIMKVFPMNKDGMLPEECGFLTGEDILRHLSGCTHLIMFAATLGSSVDQLIMRAQVEDLSEALILDACGNVLIEKYCDGLEAELRERYAAEGKSLTGRFSPGYGDLPVDIQPVFLRVLDTARRIGLTVSAGGVMLPKKSVTAIIGISDFGNAEGIRRSCAACTLADTCRFKKERSDCEQ